MKKEQRWELRYAVKGEDGTEIIKVCRPRSEEQREKNLAICKERGIRVISCKKLYPFNAERNQHNFFLIHNLAMNALHDIWMGERKATDEEYEYLESLRDRSERLMDMELPIAWLPWEDWKDAKELAEMAVLHRQDACIEAGRPDLVQYC